MNLRKITYKGFDIGVVYIFIFIYGIKLACMGEYNIYLKKY